MKHDKILLLFLAAFLLVSTTIVADASSKEDTHSSFYVETLPCPEDILDYASKNAESYIRSMNEDSGLDWFTFYVGQPFTYSNELADLFTFPVYNGEKVIYTFRVAHSLDGEIYGTMSTFLVDELNTYREKSSESSPLVFKVIDNALYASGNDYLDKLYAFPENEYTDTHNAIDRCTMGKLEVKNVAEPIELAPLCSSAVLSPRLTAYYFINLSLIEVQPSKNNWCAAYCTAAILRTRTGDSKYTAKGIMQYFYGGSVADTQNLPLDKAISYAKNVAKLRDTKYSATALSHSKLMEQIDSSRLVCLSMKNLTDGYSSHAVVLRGYDTRNNTWSIWNPRVDNSYDSFKMGGEYISWTGNHFRYEDDGRTIYDFWAS